MRHETIIMLGGEAISVTWESLTDFLEPEGKMFTESQVLECPEWALKKYGEGIIIFKCMEVEEQIEEEKRIERKEG